MTWSVSLSAPNKAAAKLATTIKLAASMLAQAPHARDFNMVHGALHGAIDACAEGVITVSAGGSLSGSWVDGDIPAVVGVQMSMNVYSTPAAPPA